LHTARITELKYPELSATLFRSIADLPWPVWLDSAARGADGRYDVIAADPYCRITTRGERTTTDVHGLPPRVSSQPPLELLRAALGPRVVRPAEVPFAGGAIGYLSYDLGRRFERVANVAAADVEMPELAVGVYDWAAIVDHHERRAWLVGAGRDARTFARWDALVARVTGQRAPAPGAPFHVLSGVTSSVDRAGYAAAFDRVQDHIRRGDCYQVNLTQRFSASCTGDPWHAYLQLRSINPAPFCAYLDLPCGKILSSSPERFIKLAGTHVQTKPIKGTRRRAADPKLDRANAQALRASGKDRAENVMIVDLLRNDLGRVCVPGSIAATKLFDVETFASVHHLVSTVEGTLAPGKDALDVLAAAFPGGSITGAPKVSAMRIIEEVEPYRRGVYCGCIGYVGFDGDMDMSIAIRTLVQHGATIYAWAGGGVVADSNVDAEYQESFDKAAALLEVLKGSSSTPGG
jgi:para-aminobenzoate synthetase component 1